METEKREVNVGDIVKIEDLGWVKVLPCGPKDTVYTIEYDYFSEAKKVLRTSNIAFGNVKHAERYGKNYRVKEISMTEKRYGLIGYSVFLSKEEAEKAIQRLTNSKRKDRNNGKR